MTAHRVSGFLNVLSRMPAHQSLFVSANQIIEIQRTFFRIVSPQLAKRCIIGKFSDGLLVIYADSSAIAAKLKYITPSLLRKFDSQVESIQIIVYTDYRKNLFSISSKQKPQLSQRAAQNLNQFALAMPLSPLRTAIESLLNNCKTEPNHS
ncbi:DciA family protein [Nitrosomonas sp. Nm33]|uniref:DciA family protein n=1 Tax=Nitrosomonas sp. Nm33 TaxID=133724 RepID=UPI000899F03F|nr:DciA family protein [Nitrosomonas sp. Nm33]SDY88079.1 Protein of unknown function [Nitrosomonas sp. Nm33]